MSDDENVRLWVYFRGGGFSAMMPRATAARLIAMFTEYKADGIRPRGSVFGAPGEWVVAWEDVVGLCIASDVPPSKAEAERLELQRRHVELQRRHTEAATVIAREMARAADGERWKTDADPDPAGG